MSTPDTYSVLGEQRQPAPLSHHSETGTLPSPPSDYERDLYFGPQLRWVSALSFLSSAVIIASFTLFMYQRIWGLVLVVPVAVAGVGAVISLFSSSRKRRYTLAEHRAKVTHWAPDYLPTVDVFLPSAGEPLELLANAYGHVAAMSWPATLTVHVLDDSDRSEVAALAQAHGFDYHVRPDRGRLKKAGNLRYGYEHSNGDMIMILDADFVPRVDFLYELMPYMDDPALGIVQSPQFFDFTKTMNWIEQGAGATQVLFYRWIQPSRDKSNAAICVGTCALYRRQALDAAGGFAQIGHSEDVHTGVNLMRAGYGVRYVPINLAKGTCPDGFDSFVTQQYRWATGSFSLLFDKKFHRAPFSAMQRLSYWTGFLYFGGTGMNVFTASIPPILMAILAPQHVGWTNYALVALAISIRVFLIPVITMGRCNFVRLARIQTTYSFSHAVALWDRLRNHSDSWVATGSKVRSKTAERVTKLSRTWIVFVQVVSWPLITLRLIQYGTTFVPLVLFTALNLMISVPLLAHRDVKGFL